MKINKINYEEYLVNSLEGLLSTEEQAELDSFLYKHPELKQDVNAYKRVFLVADKTITYPNKSLLFKPEPSQILSTFDQKRSVKINSLNYEAYIINNLEGKLTTEEQAMLDSYLHDHPELKYEVEAYKMTFLVPDESVKYDRKMLLYKSETVVRPLNPFYKRYSVLTGAAAAILLLLVFRFSLYNTFLNSNTVNTPEASGQSYQQNYLHSSNASFPGRTAQEDFPSLTGNPQGSRVINYQTRSVFPIQVAYNNQEIQAKDVSSIPVKEAAYIPQQQNRRLPIIPTDNSEHARIITATQLAQRNQSAWISNAASVGKTIWHLSGRQLPNEAANGQQQQISQVSYDSKVFSFIKVVH